ncbi:unnamed protein product [Soboliphyme baturini]|uniref:N-acetyltransferase domain-containing protein n=1 Tax=Soboliphyme baturini TaxID=241478 RepID=A0A183ICU1_9BILA|nr:unnamed protein product [Soboliphyme baturini]
MKANRNVSLRGCLSVLVPYRRHHVKKYHQWMESEELRRLTASERLTLYEEFEMQKQWQKDEDKCTFIILAKSLVDSGVTETACMVGDVNLFLNAICDDPDSDDSRRTAELEIMIAEKAFRHKGFGKEAAILMMVFAVEVLRIGRFYVKINRNNVVSIQMFDKLGFTFVSRDEYFNEVLMRLDLRCEVARSLAVRHHYECVDDYPPDRTSHPSV